MTNEIQVAGDFPCQEDLEERLLLIRDESRILRLFVDGLFECGEGGTVETLDVSALRRAIDNIERSVEAAIDCHNGPAPAVRSKGCAAPHREPKRGRAA